MLRHLRPVAGHSAVPERVQGVAKDIFHCCVAFAFDAAGPALDQRDLNRRLPAQIGFWMHGFEIAAERGRFIYDRADRKSVVEGKSVSVRVDLGWRRILKKKKQYIICAEAKK